MCCVERHRGARFFSNFDRMIFVCLYRIAPRILDAITIVEPETVIRWHRAGFRSFWRWKSSRRAGRPSVPPEIRRLIREMSLANPLWGAPRIHGELLKLGIDVGQTSVAKYMARRRRPPSQGWRTFLLNHADGIASIDLFVVPTISFKLLYGLLILRHDRRRIVWVGVTTSPTSEWIARQVREACGWEPVPDYLVRDRDRVYGQAFARRLRAMGIRDRPTAPRSPWQNGYAERLIGSIRRECLDHVIVLGERHLRHVLGAYQQYYNGTRTHLALAKDSPLTRSVQTIGRILPLPILGGYTIVTSGSDLRQGQGCNKPACFDFVPLPLVESSAQFRRAFSSGAVASISRKAAANRLCASVMQLLPCHARESSQAAILDSTSCSAVRGTTIISASAST